MSTFTPKQQNVLLAISELLQSIAKHYTMDVARSLENRIEAVIKVLAEKNVCGAEEIREARRTIESDAAVLRGLDPDIQAAIAEFNKMVLELHEDYEREKTAMPSSPRPAKTQRDGRASRGRKAGKAGARKKK